MDKTTLKNSAVENRAFNRVQYMFTTLPLALARFAIASVIIYCAFFTIWMMLYSIVLVSRGDRRAIRFFLYGTGSGILAWFLLLFVLPLFQKPVHQLDSHNPFTQSAPALAEP